jgi:pimeloyl-ACP methyl ester carboxylesterase
MPSEAEALAHLRLASEIAGLELDELALPTRHHVVLDGLRIHYLDWGNAERPPLLFLHGGSLTAHTWDLVCLALRRDYHCVAVDQRGHGDSEWSPVGDYGPDANARDIRLLIEQLQLRGPVLVGQSLGGLHALAYTASAADSVAAVALVDVAPGVESTGAQRVADFALNDPGPRPFEDFVRRALAFNPRRDPRLLRNSLKHSLRRLPDGMWTWKYDRRRLDAGYFESTKAHVERLRESASAIVCPVLVVRGADSDVLSDAAAADFAAALPHGRWRRVDAAGHNVQGDNPRGLVRALAGFLADIGH